MEFRISSATCSVVVMEVTNKTHRTVLLFLPGRVGFGTQSGVCSATGRMLLRVNTRRASGASGVGGVLVMFLVTQLLVWV